MQEGADRKPGTLGLRVADSDRRLVGDRCTSRGAAPLPRHLGQHRLEQLDGRVEIVANGGTERLLRVEGQIFCTMDRHSNLVNCVNYDNPTLRLATP